MNRLYLAGCGLAGAIAGFPAVLVIQPAPPVASLFGAGFTVLGFVIGARLRLRR